MVAPYDQLVEWGIGRRFISQAIKEAERLGLLEVRRGGKKPFTPSPLSRYRLTFLPERVTNEWGHVYFGAPTFMPSSGPPKDD